MYAVRSAAARKDLIASVLRQLWPRRFRGCEFLPPVATSDLQGLIDFRMFRFTALEQRVASDDETQ